jgi:hypothetical protein
MLRLMLILGFCGALCGCAKPIHEASAAPMASGLRMIATHWSGNRVESRKSSALCQSV